MPKRIRYTQSPDGAAIAWTSWGAGARTIILLPNHYGRIQDDSESPFRGPILRALSANARVVSYDLRGFGLSTNGVTRHGLDAWVEDLGAVIDASCGAQSVALIGISQGAPIAATFAARPPARVTHLMVYGAMACGARAGGNPDSLEAYNAKIEIIRRGWSRENPGVRMYVTTELISDPTPEELKWFDRYFQDSATAEDMVRYMEAFRDMDARPYLPRVAAPTLVVHTDGDQLVPRLRGQAFAQAIPGAQYAELHGRNHMTRESDGTRAQLIQHFRDFLDGEARAMPALSPREHEILAAVCKGFSNEAIALNLSISEKTVRNHLSRVFAKLGVNSRTQAAMTAVAQGLAAPDLRPRPLSG